MTQKTRLIEFRHKGKFFGVFHEVPKDTGLHNVQPHMEHLRNALPARWKDAELKVWYILKQGGYDYTVEVKLKTITHTLSGTSYDF